MMRMVKGLMRPAIASLALALSVIGCDELVTEPTDGVVFVVEAVPGETFRIMLNDEARIAKARDLLASGDAMVVHGELERGTGGFNTGFSWHLKASSVTFVDMAMELCDGRPSYVESEIDYFIESVKYYCPWGAVIIAEVQLAAG